MGIYKRSDSSHWWMRITHDGKTFQKSTKTTNKKLATKIYCKVTTQIAEGTHFEVDEGKRRTFAELAIKYESQVFKELRQWEKSQSYLNQLKDFFGPYTLFEIQPPLIDDFKQMRKAKGVSKATINRQLNILKRMLRLAKKRWQWLKDVPEIEMEPNADKKRKRYLSFSEYHKLLKHCEDWLKEIVVVAAWTGLRQSNVINLERNEVNLSSRIITVDEEKTKNGETLTIPLSAPAYDVLNRVMRVVYYKSPYIFCQKDGTPYHQRVVQRAFKKAVSSAKIEDFRFHDLRHCYASWNRQAGASLDDIAELLGHKDTRMAKRYSHITVEHLSQTIERAERNYEEYATTFSLRSNKKGLS